VYSPLVYREAVYIKKREKNSYIHSNGFVHRNSSVFFYIYTIALLGNGEYTFLQLISPYALAFGLDF